MSSQASQFKQDMIEARATMAISKMWQAKVNKFVKANLDYDLAVNADKGEHLQLKYWDKAADVWAILPAREKLQLIKTHEYLTMGCY